MQTQVEKLTRENAAAAAQLDELRRACEALKEELAAMDAVAAEDKAGGFGAKVAVRTTPSKPFGKILSMGKNRVGTLGSASGNNSPAPSRRPSEPQLTPTALENDRYGTSRASIPTFQPPPPVPSSPPKSPQPPQRPNINRADSLPVFRERAATSSVLPAMRAGMATSDGGLNKSSKLAAILGEEIQELPVEEGLQYMRDKDTDAVLVRGGTLDALIGKLITAEGEGKAYTDSFLITYRSVIDPPALFEKLAARYASTFNGGEEDKNQDRTRLKILAFFRAWVDKYFFDWDPDEFPTMLERYRHWLNNDVLGAQAKVAQQLAEAAERKVHRGGVLRLENQFDEPAPKPIRPPLGFCKVTDIDAVELARQFCLVESRLFQAIKPKEYLGKGWEAKNKEVVAPNLSAFIAHFNRISNWVAATVVDAPDEKKRVALLEYWIRVAEKLFELNNFAGLMELVGGLGSTSVARLKKTWKNVSRSRKAAWDKLLQQMSPQKSFANYRACIRQAHAPLVPYLGVYMQDMVFIEDGNPDFLKENGYINFHKRRLLADVIKDIVQHQLAPYNIEPVDEIVDFLALQQPEPETVLYQRSLVIQPREAD